MTAPLDLASLPRLPVEDLRRLWESHGGGRRAPAQRPLLVRELAWRAQARDRGGLDAETARLLRSAVRAARQELGAAAAAGRPRRGDPARPPRPPPAAAALRPGARLVRVWRGRAHEVDVVAGPGPGSAPAFRYGGRTFASLTEVVRAITGIHWSGPRFFGLVTRSRADAGVGGVGGGA